MIAIPSHFVYTGQEWLYNDYQANERTGSRSCGVRACVELVRPYIEEENNMTEKQPAGSEDQLEQERKQRQQDRLKVEQQQEQERKQRQQEQLNLEKELEQKRKERQQDRLKVEQQQDQERKQRQQDQGQKKS